MLLRSLKTIPTEAVSHDPQILKQVILKAGEVPCLTTLSQAYLNPGQRTARHSHRDMWEVFLVEEGSGYLILNGVSSAIASGCCFVITPGEEHEICSSAEQGMRVTYFGVVGAVPDASKAAE